MLGNPGNRLLFAGVVAGAFAAVPSLAAPGTQYFSIAGGSGVAVHSTPCPDIPCNSGDVCSCVSGSGKVAFHVVNGPGVYPATYTLELSADNSGGVNSGAGGKCYGTTGFMTVTLPNGSLTLGLAGLGCRAGNYGGGNLVYTAPFYISGGTSQYATASGTGNFSGTLSSDHKLLLDASGFIRR